MGLFRADRADKNMGKGPFQPQRPETEVSEVCYQQSEGGIECYRQKRGHDHHKRLGIGQRLEQTTFFRFQGQNRQKRYGNHQQGKETGACNLLDRVDDHFTTVSDTPFFLPYLETFMSLFHDDNRGIDHRANSNGYPT